MLGRRAQLGLDEPLPALGEGYERLPDTFASLHYLAFVMLMLSNYATLNAGS